MNHSNNDLLNDMYSHIGHDNVDQKQITNDNLYNLADNKLQLSSDLENFDWNNTDSHKDKLIIAYNNKVRNKTLFPKTFYALYVEPNQEGNGHLIYSLDKDQTVVTKGYRTVPIPEDITRISMMKISIHKKLKKYYNHLYLYLYEINFYDRLY